MLKASPTHAITISGIYFCLQGSGGMLPLEKFLELDALRLLLRPSWNRSRVV